MSSDSHSSSSSTSSLSSWGVSSSSLSTSSSSEIDAALLDTQFSGVLWNRSKIISSEMSAINLSPWPTPGIVLNGLAQVVTISTTKFSVGKASLYLRHRLGGSATLPASSSVSSSLSQSSNSSLSSNAPFVLVLRVYEADTNGNPVTLLATQTLSSENVTSTGWYTFVLNVAEQNTPASGKIVFVFHQSGGDDNNYVPWLYSSWSEMDGGALYTNNGVTWQPHSYVTRSLIVMDNFDVFEDAYDDSSLRVLKSSPAVIASVLKSGNTYLATGEFDRTSLDQATQTVGLINDKMMISIVVDGSGSMGWNDRSKRRLDAINALIDKIKTIFPSSDQVLFDIVQIGYSQLENLFSLQSNPSYDTIRIDMRNPVRTTLNLDGSTPAISDGVVAFGFKNLESGHTYIISTIEAGKVVLEDGAGATDPTLGVSYPLNYQSVGSSTDTIKYSIQNEGPGAEKGAGMGDKATVAEVPASGVYQIRKSAGQVQSQPVAVTADIESGDLSISVASPLTPTTTVDIVGLDKISPEHLVVSSSGNTATLSPGVKTDFGTASSVDGTFIQTSVADQALNLSTETTTSILLKDADTTRAITFYFQSAKGGMMEWDVIAVEEWQKRSWLYVDRAATLEASATDSNTGTQIQGEVEFTIDEKPDVEEQFSASVKLNFSPPVPLGAGEDTITLESTDGIEVNNIAKITTTIGILDGYVVQEIDTEKSTVTVFPPLYEGVLMTDIEFRTPPVVDASGNEAPMNLFAVDETPITLGIPYSGPLLPTDPTPVPPLPTDPDGYNEDESRWRVRTFNVPSMWDAVTKQAVATIRVLPITEDKLSTIQEMDDKVASMFNSSQLTDEERIKLESLENAYEELIEEDPTLPDETATEVPVEEENIKIGEDYILSPKIVAVGSKAKLTSTTQAMTEEDWRVGNFSFDPSNPYATQVYASVLCRTHQIYSLLRIMDQVGVVKAYYLLQKYELSFVAPVQIFSKTEGWGDPLIEKSVTFPGCCCIDELGDPEGYNVTLPGVYANSDNTIYIDYVVYHRGILMPSGTMTVRLYDTYRTKKEVETDPGSVLPDIESDVCPHDPCGECDNKYTLASDQYQQFYREKNDMDYFASMEADEKYTAAEAIYMDDYVAGGIVIPIVNGKARLTLKDPGVITKLAVIAQVQTPDAETLYTIRHDAIWFFNPIKLTIQVPEFIPAGLDRAPTLLGATVTYFGVPVTDGTEITFHGSSHSRNLPGNNGKYDEDDPIVQQLQAQAQTVGGAGGAILDESINGLIATKGVWPSTEIKPNISKTIGGSATGCFLGPHDGPVIMRRTKTGEEVGDRETLTVKTNYQGLTVSKRAIVEWTGISEEGDKIFATLYRGGDTIPSAEINLYADGWDYAVLVVDIPASVNRGFFASNSGIYEYLVGLVPNASGEVTGVGKLVSGVSTGVPLVNGGDKRFHADSKPIDPATNITYGEDDETGDTRGWAAIKIARAFNPTSSDSAGGSSCIPTLCEKLNVSTSAKTLSGTAMLLTGCPSDNVSACTIPSPEGGTEDVVPTILWKQPLEMSAYFDGVLVTNDTPLIRDGEHTTQVMIDVTFSGLPLPRIAIMNNVLGPDGKAIPLPTLNCNIYYLQETKDIDGNVVDSTQKSDPALKLDVYTPRVSLQRTSVSQEHYHATEVDENGNGSTTKTFKSESVDEIANHDHQVVSYEVQQGFDSVYGVHTHDLRSVAIINILPLSNGGDKVCLDVKGNYDASNPLVERPAIEFTFCSGGGEEWTLDLSAPIESTTQADVTNEYSGFTVEARLTRQSGGVKLPIEDGYRIGFTLKPFFPLKSSNADETIPTYQLDENGAISLSEARDYIVVETNASSNTPLGLLSKKKNTKVLSSLEWIPSVVPLTHEPTYDSIYLDSAVAKATQNLGGSPIYDAVITGAGRLIKWQSTHPEWSGATKAIFLIADGDEQNSSKTLNQAVTRVNSINGTGVVPVIGFQMGGTHLLDNVVMRRLSQETSGHLDSIPVGTTAIEIQQTVEDSLSYSYDKFNNGSYINIVDLGQSDLFQNARFSITVPSGTKVTISMRFSDDGENWGAWTVPQTIVESQTLSLPGEIKRYMQYEMRMTGNSDFESPTFSGVLTDYLRAGRDVVFFQPITLDISQDEYVSEVIISHEADTPTLSTVTYGLVHDDTLEINDYSSEMFPKIQSGRKTVVLSRFNESAISTDNRTFKLSNGSWPSDAIVEVYSMKPGSYSGTLVDSGLYFTSPKDGTITFTEAQSGTIFACVSLSPMIRIICEIVNRGSESTVIHHVGVAYNVTKRFRIDSSGNINRQPINVVVDESSSSSLSSDSPV